jgi:putative hydroxymethylpyrimidine transport system substrate-binding protein
MRIATRWALVGTLALGLGFVVAACGSDSDEGSSSGGDLGTLKLELDYIPNAMHTAVFWADEKGYFADEGLEVEIIPPSDAAAPLKLVSADKVDAAITYEPEVLLGVAQGLNVKAIGSVIPAPLASLIAEGDGEVQGVEDLAGKKVGEPGIPSFTAMTDAVLAEAGLSEDEVERVNVGFNLVPAVVGGQVDAMIGGYLNNEAVQVEEQTETPPVVVPVDELGVPTYDDLVFIANSDRLTDADYQAQLEAFLSAYYEAVAEVQKDPDEAIDLLTPHVKGSSFLIENSANQTFEVMAETDGRPAGCMDAGEWDAFADWMSDSGLLETPVTGSEAFTNEYLPETC